MRFLPVLLCCALLGCSCKKPPILRPSCPPPPQVVAPTLRTAALPADANVTAVLEAYVLDLADWVAHARRLEAILDGYRTPAPATPPPPTSGGK